MGLIKKRQKINLCGLAVGIVTYIVVMIVSLLAVYGVVELARLLGWLS